MRITTGTMTVGIVAIFVGLIGAYAIRTALIPEPPASPPPGPQVTSVPLASLDLPVDRIIKLGDISLMPMTAQQMRERELPLEVTMLGPDQIIGRRLREVIKQGQPFLTTAFYPEGEGPREPNVYESLPPGYRAVVLPLPVEETASVAVGGLVDVLFRANPAEGIPEMLVTLIEGAQVLKIDEPAVRSVRPPSDGGGVLYVPPPPFTVTLGVPYEDARKIQVVEGKGDLSFVARSPDDVSSGRFSPLTLAQVLQLQTPPEPARITPFQTEIYLGTTRQINSFDPGLVARNEERGGLKLPNMFDASDLRETPKPPSPGNAGPQSAAPNAEPRPDQPPPKGN